MFYAIIYHKCVWYSLLSNFNESFWSILRCWANHQELLLNIFITLVLDLIAYHSQSQSPHIPREDDLIITNKSSLRTSCCIQSMKFYVSIVRDLLVIVKT